METSLTNWGISLTRTAGTSCIAWVICSLVLLSTQILSAADPDSEYAGVNSVRIEEPDGELRLRESGTSQSQSLASFYLGLNREMAGDIDGALSAWEDVLRKNPGQIDLAARAALLSAEDGDVERGLRIVEQAYQRNRHIPAGSILLTEYLATWNRGQPESIERAQKIMEDAVKRFPGEPDVYDRLVGLYLMGRKRSEAEALLNKAMDRQDKDPWFWLEIAGVAANVWPPDVPGNMGILNGLHERALELAKSNQEVQTAVADFYGLSGQYDQARKLYEKIVDTYPEELFAREKLARVYSILGLRDKVLETLQDLERINPHRIETQKFLAETFQKLDDIPNAVAHYQKAFRLSRGTAREYWAVSYMLMSLERYQEAVELLERARFHYPEDPRLLIDLARGYNSVEDYSQAFTVFQEAEQEVARIQPESLDYLFYFSFGAAAERLDRFDKAAELFRKSIEMVPEDQAEGAAMPYNYLGYMWLEQGMNIDEAGQLIIMANELRPNSGAYVDSLGWYFFKKGDYPRALQTLLRAEELLQMEEQEDAVVFDHIAQAWYSLGYQDEALDYMERAVSLDPEKEEFVNRLKDYRKGKDLPAEEVPLEFLKPEQPAEPGRPGNPSSAGPTPAAAA